MKMPSWDAYEGDDDELEDSDCLPRLLEDVQSVPRCIVIPATPPRRLFHSAPLIVRRLFEGGVYSRKYGMSRVHDDLTFTAVVEENCNG